MSRSALALFFLASHAVLAGCLSFVEPPSSSDCTRSQSELVWLNPVRLMERVTLPHLPYDPRLYDSALSQGLAVKGNLQFDLRVAGPHLVEIFLAVEKDDSHSIVLEGGGQVVDSRYAAVSESGGLRGLCLLGVLSGPFSIRSSAARYVISAIRWTPQKQFEAELASAWLDRARQLAADPFLEDLRSQRRSYLEQLYGRMALSSRPEVRREAIIGQARMAYWLAAESQEPQDVARLDSLLREAFKIAPDDRILREVISSSCSDRNVNSGHLAYGGYCTDAVPVTWPVVVAPDPPNAPEWAVTQRRLATRLESITRWWVERRQQSNGEIGGGWRSDVEMLRQWALQALGLGTPVAATGIRKLANGYTREVGDAGHSKEYPTWLLLALDDATGDLRLPDAAGQDFHYMPDASPFETEWNMTSLAKQGESTLSRDFDMYTSEVIYTDRVYYPLGPRYSQYLLGGEAPRGDGDPAFAVTWQPAETQFARAVLEATGTSLHLRLYSFETKPAGAQVRVWRLVPGKYRWVSTDLIGTELGKGDLIVSRRAQKVSIPLPPSKEIDVTIRQVQP
jgi:hypothetical protein